MVNKDKDLGCQFVLGGDFNVERLSEHAAAAALQSFCSRNRLIWLQPGDDSIGFTFHNDTNLHYSLIDHFLCSSNFTVGLQSVRILVHGDNTSDHLVIKLCLNISSDVKFIASRDNLFRQRWDRADLDTYQNVLSVSLSGLTLPVDAFQCAGAACSKHSIALDKYYGDIVNCLRYAATVTVPLVKTGVEKHWWTPDLDDLKAQCIDATDLWRLAGSPRSGELNSNRIRIKLKYKNAIKEAVKAAEADLNEELVNHLCSKNNTSFWKAWRKRFCMNNVKTTSVLNGVSGDVNILKEFSDHFRRIGQPNTIDADEKYGHLVNDYLSSHPAETNIPFVDVQSVSNSILQLKAHKAEGHDGLVNEHIIHGGPHLIVHITLLFNALLRHAFVPVDFWHGIIKPLL